MTGTCSFCGRYLKVNRSHITPQCKGGKEWVEGCACCESFIHATWSHNQLRDEFSTVAKICATPEYQKFLKWLIKQPLTVTYKTERKTGRAKGKYR